MEINNFLQLFSSQFDETEPGDFRPETKFKDLAEWSSLKALFIIAVVAEEFSVTLTGDDIRNSQTIIELYDIINNRTKNSTYNN